MWQNLCRALFVLLPAVLIAEEQALFEVKGKVIGRRVRATVGLFDTASPFNQTTYVNLDGSFKFKKIPAGIYVVSIFVTRRGEIRRTLPVGPASADEHGRVTMEIRPERVAIDSTAANLVSIHALAVPGNARKEYEKGVKKLSKRDVEGGIHHFERAVEIAPTFAAAWNYLGTIAYQTRRINDAERYFQQAKNADPQAYEPIVNLGGVLVTLGRLEEAKSLNLSAVERRPADPLAHSQLGLTYLRMKNYELAEKHLLAAVRLDPRHFTNPQLYLAEVYVKRNQLPKAARQLADLLRQHPDWPDADKVRETISRWNRPPAKLEFGGDNRPAAP